METSLKLGLSDVCSQLASGVNLGKHTAEMKLCFSQFSYFEALDFEVSHCRYNFHFRVNLVSACLLCCRHTLSPLLLLSIYWQIR